MPPAPFSSSRLPFWGASCLPFGIPGEPFWFSGTTLEGHGSGRVDTRWSGTGFLLILEWFRDPCILAFWFQEAWNSIFFWLVSESFCFYWFMSWNVEVGASDFKVFSWKVLQKSIFHRKNVLRISDSTFVVFVGPWGLFLWFFCALKTSLKNNGFLVCKRILRCGTGVVINVRFDPITV